MIAENRLDVLIFVWDPLEPQPHDPDVKALLRLAALWNAPAACNAATADLMITSPLFGGDYHWQRPQIDPRQWHGEQDASQPPEVAPATPTE
jgi:methylglyoxal synthase